jgi:two-component system, chemotaxis family, sensor kinase CheA
MSTLNDKNRELYRAEAYELLADLESCLLDLESTPDDKDLIGGIFRALHTIKGSGAMFGFDDIAAFAHKIETVFDLVRSGKVSVTRGLIDLTFSAVDHIKDILENAIPDTDMAVRGEEIVSRIKELLPLSSLPESCEASSAENSSLTNSGEDLGKNAAYRIRFSPSPNILRKGLDPLKLLNELRQLGRCETVAITDAIPNIEDMNPESCYTSWDIILITNRGINEIKDVFIFVEDDGTIQIDVISEDIGILSETQYKKLGEILVERKDLTTDAMQKILKEKKLFGEILLEKGLVSDQKIRSALVEQDVMRDAIQRYQRNEAASSIRVSSKKLDRLVDLVGELVTVQVRLCQNTVSAANPELLSISEEIERLTAELRESTMSIRMLPIGTTFSKFKRLVRDLSKELGKDVHLFTEGFDTELDKTMIEKLNDPLVHLIRNSIDHGIEDPGTRQAEGKPKIGTIVLSAVHSGSHVLIRIRDDGRGLDPDSIYEKALEKGIISRDAKLTEKEIFSLLLAPGFSTAKQITDVSGRGVGLDVVQKGIETLKGTIDITGKKGSGTTITLTLPLTLAIIEGLLVRVSEENFVIPLSTVEECVELTRRDIDHAHGRHMAYIRGQFVPYIRLRERFAVHGTPPPIEYIVITANEGVKIGLVVDHIIGEHQTVIKSLNKFYKNIQELSGATILGDGSVALVVDVQKLIREFEKDTVCNTLA